MGFLLSLFLFLDSIVWRAARQAQPLPSHLAWIQRLRVGAAVAIISGALAQVGLGVESESFGLICLAYCAFSALYSWYFFYIQDHCSMLLGDLVRTWRLDQPKAEVASTYSWLLAVAAVLNLGMAAWVSLAGMGTSGMEVLETVLPLLMLFIYLIVSPLIPVLRNAHRTVGANCFLSYATEDHEFVERVRDGLESRHISCFHDKRHVLGGDELATVIGRGISTSDVFLVVLSTASITSPWVRDETFLALHYERMRDNPIVIPIRLCNMEIIEAWRSGGDDVAAKLRARSIVDFENASDDWEKSLDRLREVLITTTGSAG